MIVSEQERASVFAFLFYKRNKKLVPRALLSYTSTLEFLRTLDKCEKASTFLALHFRDLKFKNFLLGEHAPRLSQVWGAFKISRYAANYRYLIAYEINTQGWKKRRNKRSEIEIEIEIVSFKGLM